MMDQIDPAILVAGAGWRIWRFIVPALFTLGVPRERITVLRRSRDAELHPMLSGLRVVSSLEEFSEADFAITINCVAATSLVQIEEALTSRFPFSLHLCDTPIFGEDDKPARMIALSLKPLFSLEDWPLMPNLDFFIRQTMADKGPKDLQIENFGIFTHFFSLYRAIHGGWKPCGRTIVKNVIEASGEPRRDTRVTFRYQKELPRAKIRLQTADEIVEDFFEVEPEPHAEHEIVYRVVDGHRVFYYRGPQLLSAHMLDQAVVDTFRPFEDRKNVHEFDKFVGLVDMLGKVISGKKSKPYSYLSSVRDTIIARQLAKKSRCFFL
jgi:hypothetical protein